MTRYPSSHHLLSTLHIVFLYFSCILHTSSLFSAKLDSLSLFISSSFFSPYCVYIYHTYISCIHHTSLLSSSFSCLFTSYTLLIRPLFFPISNPSRYSFLHSFIPTFSTLLLSLSYLSPSLPVPRSGHFDMSNLFNDNVELRESTLKVLNSEWGTLSADIQPRIMEAADRVFRRTLQKFWDIMPYEQFFEQE